jgi:hypothetical protein
MKTLACERAASLIAFALLALPAAAEVRLPVGHPIPSNPLSR